MEMIPDAEWAERGAQLFSEAAQARQAGKLSVSPGFVLNAIIVAAKSEEIKKEISITRHEIKEEISELRKHVCPRRKRIPPLVQRFVIDKTIKYYGGMCPICEKVLVASDGKKTKDGEFDHYRRRDIVDVAFVWLICKQCNRRREETGESGYKFFIYTQRKFESYHMKGEAPPPPRPRSSDQGNLAF